MTAPIFAYLIHKDGMLDDTATELVTAAAAIDSARPPVALVAGHGPDLDAACVHACEAYGEVWRISHAALASANAELIRQALVAVLPREAIVLIPHGHFSVDLAPGLSIKLNAAFVPDVTAIDGVSGSTLRLVRQEFGGQVSTHVRCDIASGAVITTRPGAFAPREHGVVAGRIVDMSPRIGALGARRRYLATTPAESGDVDITKEQVLVSIGRGIQEQDNVAIAEDLAEMLGGAVSCSRPVVDARWMEKSRQVGSSGRTVKPKVYLACGISGSFQHLAGLKGNPFIVAINKNPKAPIFRVANLGIVDDILEFLPALTARIRDLQGVYVRR